MEHDTISARRVDRDNVRLKLIADPLGEPSVG